MYAVQHKTYGTLVDTFEQLKDAIKVVNWNPEHLEVVDIDNASKLKVVYTELGGPYGYGHQEPSFTTYGGLRRVIVNFYKWVQDTARVFGPDIRDVKDYFRHCTLTVNGIDKTPWLLKQVEKLDRNKIFI